MYNLVVSNLITDYLPEPITIDRRRFLEYTGDFIARQLGTLSNEGITALKSWPCLVMQEGRGEERAYVARLADVAARRRVVEIKSCIFSSRTNPCPLRQQCLRKPFCGQVPA